jgi:hypothetical protein
MAARGGVTDCGVIEAKHLLDAASDELKRSGTEKMEGLEVGAARIGLGIPLNYSDQGNRG